MPDKGALQYNGACHLHCSLPHKSHAFVIVAAADIHHVFLTAIALIFAFEICINEH